MSLFWLNYLWQTVAKASHSPLKFRVLFLIYNHYSIPHLHFNTEVLLSRWQTLTISWYIKFCQLIMPLSFCPGSSTLEVVQKLNSILWSSCIWIPKKISKLHITMKSLLRHSTPRLSNRKWSFQERPDLCRFSFLWTEFISVPGEEVKMKLSSKTFPVVLFHKEK